MKILFATFTALGILTAGMIEPNPIDPIPEPTQGVQPVPDDRPNQPDDQLDRIEQMVESLIAGQDRIEAGQKVLSRQLNEIKDGADKNTDRMVEAILSLKQEPQTDVKQGAQPRYETPHRIEYQQVCENGVCRIVERRVPINGVEPVDPDPGMPIDDPGFDPGPGCGDPSCTNPDCGSASRRTLFNGRILNAWRNIRARWLNKRVSIFNARWN